MLLEYLFLLILVLKHILFQLFTKAVFLIFVCFQVFHLIFIFLFILSLFVCMFVLIYIIYN